MCCVAHPARLEKLCRAIVKRESLKLELQRVGAQQRAGIEGLQAQIHHWNTQIEWMRSEPGYDMQVDAFELTKNDAHLGCRHDTNQLRNQLLASRAKNEDLFVQNALLKAEIRKVRPTRRPLAEAAGGEVDDLGALLEAYTGHPVPALGNLLQVSRQVAEKIVALVAEAERISGQSMKLFERPKPGDMVPLSSMVAG